MSIVCSVLLQCGYRHSHVVYVTQLYGFQLQLEGKGTLSLCPVSSSQNQKQTKALLAS